MKTFYINEGRNFDITDEARKQIVEAGFKFYHQYLGYRKGDSIFLVGEDSNEVEFDYSDDIFVH